MTLLDDCIAHGCLDADELSALGPATTADRAILTAYLDRASGEDVICFCARLRTDITLARARGDAAETSRLLRALRAYLVEHGVGVGGCPSTRGG